MAFTLTPETAARHWGRFVGLGAALVALGVFALGALATMTIVTITTFGVLMALAGILAIVHAFGERKHWGGVALHVVTGLFYLVAGGYMVAYPAVTSVTLTMVVGVALLLSGCIRIVLGMFAPRFPHRGLVVLSGVPTVLLGLIILARWPLSGLWVIGLFVAIELIMAGWGYIMLGVGARGRTRPAALVSM